MRSGIALAHQEPREQRRQEGRDGLEQQDVRHARVGERQDEAARDDRDRHAATRSPARPTLRKARRASPRPAGDEVGRERERADARAHRHLRRRRGVDGALHRARGGPHDGRGRAQELAAPRRIGRCHHAPSVAITDGSSRDEGGGGVKALAKSEARPGIWLVDAPEPEVGINDVLIRVLRTGICGTDLHIRAWDAWAQRTIPVPMVVGHEFVGEVVEVGSNVNDFAPGDIVSGEGHLVCGRCRNCMAGRRHLCAHTQGVGVDRTGAFAELIALPMTNVWKHAPGIDLDVAAIFDPYGNAVHTALAFPVLGEDVLITGAGPIGIMAAAVVRHAGARHVVVTDMNPYRLELARQRRRHARARRQPGDRSPTRSASSA